MKRMGPRLPVIVVSRFVRSLSGTIGVWHVFLAVKITSGVVESQLNGRNVGPQNRMKCLQATLEPQADNVSLHFFYMSLTFAHQLLDIEQTMEQIQSLKNDLHEMDIEESRPIYEQLEHIVEGINCLTEEIETHEMLQDMHWMWLELLGL